MRPPLDLTSRLQMALRSLIKWDNFKNYPNWKKNYQKWEKFIIGKNGMMGVTLYYMLRRHQSPLKKSC